MTDNWRTEPMDDNMPQQQREALKALEWIEHIIETESGAPADVALEVLREYVSRPVPEPFAWYRKHRGQEVMFAHDYDGPPPEEQGWITLYALAPTQEDGHEN